MKLAEQRHRRWGRRSPHSEADVIQMAWVSVVRAAREFDPGRGASFKTFAWRLICCDLRMAGKAMFCPKRGAFRNEDLGERVIEELALAPQSHAPRPFGADDAAQRDAMLREARRSLMDSCRRLMTREQYCVVRMLAAGSSWAEIVAETGATFPAVEHRARRAQLTARTLLYRHRERILELCDAN